MFQLFTPFNVTERNDTQNCVGARSDYKKITSNNFFS